MFRLTDGRDYFYQWDLDRQVIVEDPSVTEVHFCNRTDDCSLVVKVYADPLDSELKADVPNILLQDTFNIRVYAYCDCYTKVEEVFKVKPRTKPSDYVYTETEVLQYSNIANRMDNLEQNIGNEVAKYMEENPIEVDLTEYAKKEELPTVPDKVSAFENDKGYLTEHQDLTGLATEEYVDNAVNNLDIPEVDLTGYATERWVNNQGFLTTVPSQYVTEDELSAKGYINANSLDPYAKKTDIPEVPTKVSELENDKGYLTEHQSLAGLATTNYVDKAVSNIEIPDTDLTGYATEEWVVDRGYARKEYVDQSISNIDLSEYATTNYVDEAIEEGIEVVEVLGVSDDGNGNVIFTAEDGSMGNYFTKEEIKANYALKTDIPTVVSAFSNDSGYTTETYVNDYVSQTLSSLGTVLKFKGKKEYSEIITIKGEMGDVYITSDGKEYVCVYPAIGGYAWELIGTTVDLTAYATEDYVDTAISNIPEPDLTGYATTESLNDNHTTTGSSINLEITTSEAANICYTYSAAISEITKLTTTLTQGVSVQFTTGSTVTNSETNTYFIGDDCENGVFTPVADTDYEIVMWSYKGSCKAGVVNYG